MINRKISTTHIEKTFFYLTSIINKFLQLSYDMLDDCFLYNKSTSTHAHYVGCKRHENQFGHSWDSKP